MELPDQQSRGLQILADVWGLDLAYKILVICFATLFIPRFFFATRDYKVFPAWAAVEVGFTSHVVGEGRVSERTWSFVRGTIALILGVPSVHKVIYDLTQVDRFFAQSHHALDSTTFQYNLFGSVFGVSNDDVFRERTTVSLMKRLTGAVERVFVNEAGTSASLERADVPAKSASLVSFSDNPEKMQIWERAARIRIVEPAISPGQPGAVEADLHSLLRDFGACIAIPRLYGQDFLSRNQTILRDLWSFDNNSFSLLMIGMPSWLPLKKFQDGLAARSRLANATEALYKRVEQYQCKQPIDFGADMSDISAVVLERSTLYQSSGMPLYHRGAIDTALLWAQNANTQPLLFWFLTYIYSTPGLLADLRKEIDPFVSTSATSPSEIIAFNLRGISRDCPLFKSALFETYRLCSDPASIRYVHSSATVSDGEVSHNLRANTWISIPHAVVQKNAAVFKDPKTFIPGRFLGVDESGNTVARYGRMRPWGAGHGICKGRTFAEKEILAIAAAVIALWDMEPVTADGKWDIPSRLPGTGAMKPDRDIRVVLKRRVDI